MTRGSKFELPDILAMLCLLLTGCHKPAPPPQRPPPAVTANRPVQREVMEWDEYPGRLEAVDMIEVRARVSGYLQSVHFKDGAEVKKGELLFLIDPRQYHAELDRAEADLKQAQTVDKSVFVDPIDKLSVDILTDPKSTARFDASDLMPSEVGTGSFWTWRLSIIAPKMPSTLWPYPA